MYHVGVRDSFMIAHSFKGAVFGPAQRLHGATYTVDVELSRLELDADGIVTDIGKLSELVHGILAEFNFHNLDDFAEFAGQNTTTEFMAAVIGRRLVAQIHGGALGAGSEGLTRLSVKLHESHNAWAAFETALAAR